MRQAYIFPGHISAMATTVTEKGITNKELLCEWNVCLSLCLSDLVFLTNDTFLSHLYRLLYKLLALVVV